jgi:hypothetical protein
LYLEFLASKGLTAGWRAYTLPKIENAKSPYGDFALMLNSEPTTALSEL